MSALREGFTTGSCAAACALASCLWRKTGECPDKVEIVVPEGRTYAPVIIPLDGYECAVIKDSGDDPDITSGSQVRALVEILPEKGNITYLAGEGVGIITLPGLKLPVGEAAINPVPRQMISDAIRSVYPENAAKVTVSITGGRELALKTFNPRLGIEGGLSVLGTSGVVRPMSDDALMETIGLELTVKKANGVKEITLVFGAQGETAVKALYPGAECVQMSNFVGFALDEAARIGFERITVAGQPGKLVKVSGGSMQTHSKYGDGRKEPLIAHLALMDAPKKLLESVWESVTLDGVITPIKEAGYSEVWNALSEAASNYCMARIRNQIPVDAIMLDRYGNVIGAFRK